MSQLKGFKILVVEDDPFLREYLVEDLVLAGVEVASAESGQAALEQVQSQDFDAVLSDMRMPNGDGLFLAREILQLSQGHKPLFFLYTGHCDISSAEQKDLHITQIFSKPFDSLTLYSSIFNHLSQRKQETVFEKK